jgi:hypothetical protein
MIAHLRQQVLRKVHASYEGEAARLRNIAGFPPHLARMPAAPIDPEQPVHSMGSFDFDESTHDGMVGILRAILDLLEVPAVDESFKLRLNGDQFTCDRVRGAQLLQSNGRNPQNIRDFRFVVDKFGDFHGQWAFLKIIMGLYHGDSERVCGSYWRFMSTTGRKKHKNDDEARVYYRAESVVSDSAEAYMLGFAIERLRGRVDIPELVASTPLPVEKSTLVTEELVFKLADQFVNFVYQGRRGRPASSTGYQGTR